MTVLPRIGATIRVASIAPDLTTCTTEGVVEHVSPDAVSGSLATLRLDPVTTSTVRLTPGQGYYATWFEIKPPMRALPTYAELATAYEAAVRSLCGLDCIGPGPGIPDDIAHCADCDPHRTLLARIQGATLTEGAQA